MVDFGEQVDVLKCLKIYFFGGPYLIVSGQTDTKGAFH